MSHIAVWRQFGPVGVWHHGILLDDNTVVHYSGRDGGKRKPRIRRTTLTEFAKGRTVYDVIHELRLLPRKQIAERALRSLGEGEYNLVFKNCESFVNWCVLDAHVSKQVAPLQLALLGAKAFFGAVGVEESDLNYEHHFDCLTEKTIRRRRRIA